MFSNSRGLYISGGTFTHNYGPAIGRSALLLHSFYSGRTDIRLIYVAGFETLTKAAAPSAFYDYGHQFDVPRCHENTRVAVLEKIGEWVDLVIEITAFILWLYGAAGAGKSAIARTMAETLHSRQQLLATFFFSRADSSRNNIKSVVATLAYNITLSIPESLPLITTMIEKDPHIFHRSLAHQLEQLVLMPLRQLSMQGVAYATVIIIDGLDECLNHEERTILLHAISTATEQHSAPLKFLITSRPETPIARIFNATPAIEVSIRHSLDDEPWSVKDIRYFLHAKFDEIKRTHPSRRHIPHDWPSSQVVVDLVNSSSGQFIHPVTIIRYLLSPKHNPMLRLDIILKLRPLSGESPFALIDTLYRHILLSCDDVELALRIMGMCLLSMQKIKITQWPNALGLILGFPSQITTPKYMERILGLNPGDVQRGLEDLGSLIEYKGDTIRLRVLHASLFDFLSDPTRLMELPFNLASIHSDLAIWCSRLVSSGGSAEIPELRCECGIFILASRELQLNTVLILHTRDR